MTATTRLQQILATRGKHLAVALGAAGALAGGGSAHAATTPVAHHPAAQHRTVRPTKALFTADAAAAPAGSGPGLFHTGQASPLYAGTHASHAPAGPAHPAAAHAITARHAALTAAPAAAATTRPTTIYDSVTPASIPAGAHAAVYSDGAYATSPAAVAGHPGALWIDTNGSNPKANALDVEPGDATPAQAATWVAQKLHATPGQDAILYTMKSEWPATQAAVHALPASMQSHVKWWIADPTGVPHVVPGSNATQWYWGPSYDITTANPGF